MSPKIATIIVNWNNYDDIKKCLTSFNLLTYSNVDVIVVDNGSTNDSTKKIQKEFPQYKYIYNNKNLGYSGGVNVGIKSALEEEYDYVWLLNSDTEIVNHNYLDILIDFLENNKQCGVIGSLVLNLGDRKVQSEWFSFIDWRGRFVPINKNKNLEQIEKKDIELKRNEYLNAASVIIRPSVFRKYGLWPEEFFLYFEDNTWEDYVRKDKSVLICYTSKTYILHKGAASSGGYKKSTTLDYYDTRNYLYFIKKSYPKWILYHIGKSVINKIMPKIVRGEWERLKYVLFGFRDFFKGKTGKMEI